jgi:hypothetical protein
MEVKMNGDCLFLLQKSILYSPLIILSYGMLKVILKEITSYHEDISELLCSYVLKTTLCWVIEDRYGIRNI